MALVRTGSGLIAVARGHRDVRLPEWVQTQQIKRTLERDVAKPPWIVERYSARGWRFRARDTTVIVSAGTWPDETDAWVHASISHPERMPSYGDLAALHAGVFGDRFAYQVFAPPDRHVNKHDYCLHLWGSAGEDRGRRIPDFGMYGII